MIFRWACPLELLVHVEGFGLQLCKSLHPLQKNPADANHIHTESAGKTEAISMCTDNKQPLNLVLTLNKKSSVALHHAKQA